MVTFGSFCSSRPPIPIPIPVGKGEGGQAPEACSRRGQAPNEGARAGGAPARPPAAGPGHSTSVFPEMVVGAPRAPGSPRPGLASSPSCRARPGWESLCSVVQGKVSPRGPGRQEVGGWEGPAPRNPNGRWAGAGT